MPLLVAVGGHVASGKSTLARALAPRLGARRIRADAVRDDLLQEAPGEAVHEAHWWRDFAPGFEDEVYRELFRRAGVVLESELPVVLDACFPQAAQRRDARALAQRAGSAFLFVECRVGDAVIRERLAARDREAGQAGWEAISLELERRYERVSELGPAEHLVVHCDGDLEPLLRAVEERLAAARAARPAQPGPIAPRPHAVTFDCWNTLLVEEDWPHAHERRVRALLDAAREAGSDPSLESAARAFDAAWERHQRAWEDGRATGSPEIAAWALAELGLREPHPALEHLVSRFERASHTSRVVALPGARELLAELTQQGIPCALVCDTGLTPGREVRRLLERVGLLEHLAVQAFSDEVGAPKPDARVFRAALEPLDVRPEAALHVGDLRRTDVAGARGLGIRSVRIRQSHDDLSALAEADFVVGSHAELRARLALDAERRTGRASLGSTLAGRRPS